MPVKSFSTEERPSEERREAVQFTVDGQTLTAHRPKSYALVELSTAADGDTITQVRAIVDFMNETLDEKSRAYIQKRLRDPDDVFDLEDLVPISQFLTERFARRPTTRSKASAARPRKTGSASTARARSKGSTRSTSRQTGSAASSKSGSPSD